jgi:hypothetical protein
MGISFVIYATDFFRNATRAYMKGRVYVICVLKMPRLQWVGHMAWVVLQQNACRA